ncbi:kininogen-1 [Rhinophrynus dorsalis]
MRLLTTLLVCSHFILGSANQALTIEADCNDQNIFNVVDEALRFHNNELLDGNQFVLYRITEANIRPENDGGTHNFVSYEIHEGSCGVKSGKVWQDCDFKTPASERIKCSAHVLINKEEKINEIISQNCSIVKVEDPVIAIHHQGLGSFIPIDRNSEELLPIVQASIQKMNHLGNHPFHFDLENITSASRQVVSGWNYDIYYDVRQTNCSKLAHYSLSSADCKLDANGQRGYCKSRVFVIPTGEIKDINAQCSSEKGFCLTCPNEVDRDDPELKNLLRQVMDEYNSDSNHTNLYKITNIVKATAKKASMPAAEQEDSEEDHTQAPSDTDPQAPAKSTSSIPPPPPQSQHGLPTTPAQKWMSQESQQWNPQQR